MKKINISKLKKDLELISDSESKKTIILNNAELYNDLIQAYIKDKEQHNVYIIYQLNGMIIKQLNELEKNVSKSEKNDPFIEMVNKLKAKKTEIRN